MQIIHAVKLNAILMKQGIRISTAVVHELQWTGSTQNVPQASGLKRIGSEGTNVEEEDAMVGKGYLNNADLTTPAELNTFQVNADEAMG